MVNVAEGEMLPAGSVASPSKSRTLKRLGQGGVERGTSIVPPVIDRSSCRFCRSWSYVSSNSVLAFSQKKVIRQGGVKNKYTPLFEAEQFLGAFILSMFPRKRYRDALRRIPLVRNPPRCLRFRLSLATPPRRSRAAARTASTATRMPAIVGPSAIGGMPGIVVMRSAVAIVWDAIPAVIYRRIVTHG
jgi:hypothetical protein